MSNAYCFCPNFLGVAPVSSVIEALLHNRHSIFLDDKNKLMEEYARVLSVNTECFSLFSILEYALVDSQKLVSRVNSPQVDSTFLLETLTGLHTTETKFLASSDRQTHNGIVPRLRELNIQEIYPHNFPLTVSGQLYRSFNIDVFRQELEHSLYLVMGERNGKLEDDYNTTLASCLRAKRFIVLDQTYHGRSSTGLTLGRLDLVIQDGGYKTLIEPLKLKGMETSPFYGHLNKLLDNYNPLRIKHTFLVTYYTGERCKFLQFIADYKQRLNNLDLSQLNPTSTWNFQPYTDLNTEYNSLYLIEQQATVNGSSITCYHFIADFSDE
ncbi:hypothetical protein VCRA2120O333_70180 [Vibrio crassostreae]|uniref:hypothetical protein n=1 Tax=Vibrio crassostreae TaxID=246167 RepID=UPI001045F730|nr:hypothetical protein [Vibrio crassostreae]TCW02597.1 hypothetical protein EDB49_11815 [Vibrio crassostreae]CAK3276158.1 hypothetical protein VCRA2122O341_180014 [Vibrio crassostreae]CAK3579195.1 hypothetical protein VCRA2121O334_70062 [Vibrio crassostreae]CAK3972724.1 hypothetical protein VCRA2120O333_70180 [Vibrio crassostreae]